jgi:Uma2 family endonuclease
MSLSRMPDPVERDRGPRAPTWAEWDAMTAEQQRRAAEALPIWVELEESGGMDGDRHKTICGSVRGALRTFYEATRQEFYVSGELAVYFAGAVKVSPDVLVVRGASPHARDSWVETREGRAPEWVLEVLVLGHREKDLQRHVVEYAELGIREYFVFDVRKHRLLGYRLNDPAVAIYTRIVPQGGLYHSEVLGLELTLEGDMVRLYHGTARLLDPEEVVERLRKQLNDELRHRHDAEDRAATEAKAQSEAEERAVAAEERAAAEAKVRADAEAELERLREMVARLQRG